jgi:hypothetical protein
MKRTAIIVKKDLAIGEVANVSAILLGQVAMTCPDHFAVDELHDQNGFRHATPRYSIVVLKAKGSGQLMNAAVASKKDHPSLFVCGFSAIGQNLNNAFSEYAERIGAARTEDCGLVGIAIAGEDEAVRQSSKKFSLL